jgi:hypothetical protein
MDGQVTGAGLGKNFEQAFRLLDHEVHIEGEFRDFAASFNHNGAHAQVRDEVTIHHINMNPVRAGRFAGGNLLGETG